MPSDHPMYDFFGASKTPGRVIGSLEREHGQADALGMKLWELPVAKERARADKAKRGAGDDMEQGPKDAKKARAGRSEGGGSAKRRAEHDMEDSSDPEVWEVLPKSKAPRKGSISTGAREDGSDDSSDGLIVRLGRRPASVRAAVRRARRLERRGRWRKRSAGISSIGASGGRARTGYGEASPSTGYGEASPRH